MIKIKDNVKVWKFPEESDKFHKLFLREFPKNPFSSAQIRFIRVPIPPQRAYRLPFKIISPRSLAQTPPTCIFALSF